MKLVLQILSVSLLAGAAQAAEVPKKPDTVVPFLREGIYQLTSGKKDECLETVDVVVKDNNTQLYVGPYHIFATISKSEQLTSQWPDETVLCAEDTVDTIRSEGTATILKFEDKVTCDKKWRYTLVKTATVTKELVKLESVQTGEDAKSLTCVWKYQKKLDNN